MYRAWMAVAIGGAVLGVLGVAALSSSSAASPPAPARVALIGDSYAVGLGPELAKLFPIFRYEGVTGTTTAQWANHAAACGKCGDWLAEFRPTVVLVSLGVNDGNAPNSTNYQAIIQKAHGVGARVLWIQPPARVSAPEVRRVISSLGVPVLPATGVPLAPDGLHPQGYGTWAHEIAGEVGNG